MSLRNGQWRRRRRTWESSCSLFVRCTRIWFDDLKARIRTSPSSAWLFLRISASHSVRWVAYREWHRNRNPQTDTSKKLNQIFGSPKTTKQFLLMTESKINFVAFLHCPETRERNSLTADGKLTMNRGQEEETRTHRVIKLQIVQVAVLFLFRFGGQLLQFSMRSTYAHPNSSPLGWAGLS